MKYIHQETPTQVLRVPKDSLPDPRLLPLINELASQICDGNSVAFNQNFLRDASRSLCVYSSSMSTLYTEYTLFLAQLGKNKLVALPNYKMNQHELQGKGAESTEDLSAYILPGQSAGLKGLAITFAYEGDYIVLPFSDGIELLTEQNGGLKNLLPVLTPHNLDYIAGHSILRLSRLMLWPHADMDIHPFTYAIKSKLSREEASIGFAA